MPMWGCRGGLALRQSIGFIIHHNSSDINVAQGGVNEVSYADTEVITVSANGDHRKIGTCHFQSLCDRQGTSMHRVESESLHEMPKATGTTNARYHYRLIRGQFQARHATV